MNLEKLNHQNETHENETTIKNLNFQIETANAEKLLVLKKEIAIPNPIMNDQTQKIEDLQKQITELNNHYKELIEDQKNEINFLKNELSKKIGISPVFNSILKDDGLSAIILENEKLKNENKMLKNDKKNKSTKEIPINEKMGKETEIATLRDRIDELENILVA